MHYAMDDMIIKAVLHRPYKHFGAAFEELKGNQRDSQVSFSSWFLDRYFQNTVDYSLQNATHLLRSFYHWYENMYVMLWREVRIQDLTEDFVSDSYWIQPTVGRRAFHIIYNSHFLNLLLLQGTILQILSAALVLI